MDALGLLECVAGLFNGKTKLMKGFNIFLPPGYGVRSVTDQPELITVDTPYATITDWTNEIARALQHTRISRDMKGNTATTTGVHSRVMRFLPKVEKCYADTPDTYKTFIEMISEDARPDGEGTSGWDEPTVRKVNSGISARW